MNQNELLAEMDAWASPSSEAGAKHETVAVNPRVVMALAAAEIRRLQERLVAKEAGNLNQHELLTALDDLASRQTRTKGMPNETERLLRLAAAKIRQLQTGMSTVQRDREYVNSAIGTAEAGL
jgi:hypothetical protein